MIKPYYKHKVTNVAWLGSVPSHWNIHKFKYIVKIFGGGTPSKGNLEYWNGDIPWVSPKDMKSERIESSEDYITEKGLLNSAAKLIPPNNIILVIRSGILKHSLPIAINNVEVAINQDLKVLVPSKKVKYDFLFWLIKGLSKEILFECKKNGATVDSIEIENLTMMQVVIPPLEEQDLITRFLTNATSNIDKLLNKKEQLLALLQEKRQALIDEAITRGLDREALMKDSGIEWLGAVPANWKIRKLKTVAFLKSGETINYSYIDADGQYPVYGGNGLRGFTKTYTHKGDFILIGRQGALCGNVRLVAGYFWASEHAVVVTPSIDLDICWLEKLLIVMNLNQYSESAAQPGLSVEKIKNLQICVPSKEEQMEIADFVSNKVVKIDNVIEKISSQIEKLQEYRQALISEAVTGKIDVRHYAKGDVL